MWTCVLLPSEGTTCLMTHCERNIFFRTVQYDSSRIENITMTNLLQFDGSRFKFKYIKKHILLDHSSLLLLVAATFASSQHREVSSLLKRELPQTTFMAMRIFTNLPIYAEIVNKRCFNWNKIDGIWTCVIFTTTDNCICDKNIS